MPSSTKKRVWVLEGYTSIVKLSVARVGEEKKDGERKEGREAEEGGENNQRGGRGGGGGGG